MTKEQFVKLMTVIKDKYDTMNNIIDKFDDVFGGIGDRFIEGTDISPIIEVIAEIVGDNDDWIRWYVYEKEFGENTTLYCKDKNGNIIPSDTLEDLWELIKGGDTN